MKYFNSQRCDFHPWSGSHIVAPVAPRAEQPLESRHFPWYSAAHLLLHLGIISVFLLSGSDGSDGSTLMFGPVSVTDSKKKIIFILLCGCVPVVRGRGHRVQQHKQQEQKRRNLRVEHGVERRTEPTQRTQGTQGTRRELIINNNWI